MMRADDDGGTNNLGNMPGGIKNRKPIDPYQPGKAEGPKAGTGPGATASKGDTGGGSSAAGKRGTGPASVSHQGNWDDMGPRRKG